MPPGTLPTVPCAGGLPARREDNLGLCFYFTRLTVQFKYGLNLPLLDGFNRRRSQNGMSAEKLDALHVPGLADHDLSDDRALDSRLAGQRRINRRNLIDDQTLHNFSLGEHPWGSTGATTRPTRSRATTSANQCRNMTPPFLKQLRQRLFWLTPTQVNEFPSASIRYGERPSLPDLLVFFVFTFVNTMLHKSHDCRSGCVSLVALWRVAAIR